MQLDRIKQLLIYNPKTGVVSTKKLRVLVADHDGLVIVFDSIARKAVKIKLERLAYSLAFNKIPDENKRVLHKNLDTADNRAVNLSLVSRAVFLEVKEAYRNLNGGIRFVPHANDQFSYVVFWLEKGQEKQKIVHDITNTQQFVHRKQLKYAKILTKFCVFD